MPASARVLVPASARVLVLASTRVLVPASARVLVPASMRVLVPASARVLVLVFLVSQKGFELMFLVSQLDLAPKLYSLLQPYHF